MRKRHIVNCGLSALQFFSPRYLINGTVFLKMLLNKKYVFRFFLQIFSEIFLIPRRTERNMIVNVLWSSCKVPVILLRIEWNELSRQFFEKHWNIKFHENTSSENRVVPRGQKDGRTDMMKLIVACRNLRKRLKIKLWNSCDHSNRTL
jgi:hypothetical protein